MGSNLGYTNPQPSFIFGEILCRLFFCKRQTPGDERWGAMWRLSVSASGWVRDLGRRALIDSLTHSCSS
jgi:hypothetical protein